MPLLLLDSKLVKDVEPILNDLGIDLDTVLKMTLRRIAKDGDISFLMAKKEPEKDVLLSRSVSIDNDDRITKGRAVSLFEEEGIRFTRNITFASKNRSAYNYWANPNFYALNSDWHLILNDWKKRELHLFLIPARTIKAEEMVSRFDQKDKIDLQICYNDPTYTDNRSKIKFGRFLIKSIRY